MGKLTKPDQTSEN